MSRDTRLLALHVSTLCLPPEHAFPLWRLTADVLFGVSQPTAKRFDVSLQVWHFERFLLCAGYLAAARYRRDAVRLGWCDLDHYLLHVPLQGRGVAGSGLRVYPREVVVLDLAEPARFRLAAGRGLTLVIPRDALPVGDDARLHGLVLPRGCASNRLLTGVLTSLAASAPHLSEGESVRFCQPLLALVAACLAREAAGRAPAARAGSADLARRVRLYIEHNLQRDDLTPALLAKAVGTSRSQLYRLFERFGGVRRYLMHRRLRRCLLALGDSRHAGQRIGELAYAHGFADEAHFSKAFRQAFGLSPGAARSALLQGVFPGCDRSPPSQGAAATLRRWVIGLHGR